MIYEEFTKTSIHNHFGDSDSEKTLNDDYNKVIKMNYQEAYKKLIMAKEHNFGLLALTNANSFVTMDYIGLNVISRKLDIELIPGVELNIANNDKTKFLHTIILVDPNCRLLEFEKRLENNIVSNQANYITIEQLVSIIAEMRVIIIPHGIKQETTERSASKNIEQFEEIIAFDDAIPVIIEDNRTYHKATLIEKLKSELNRDDLAWLEKSVNISSADRTDYSEISSPSYIWGEKTFDDLYYACLMKGNRIKRESDIIKKASYLSKVEIIPKVTNPQIEKSTIYLSHGLNSIIGKSGSGKTLLLNALKKYLTGNDLKNKVTGVSAYDDIYEDVDIYLYDSNDEKVSLDSNWKVYEGENLYNKILKAYSDDKGEILKELNINIDSKKFNNIINDFSKQLNKYKDNRIKILFLEKEISTSISSLLSDIKFLNDNSIKDRSITYLKEETLMTTKKDVLKDIYSMYQDLNQIQKIKSYLLKLNRKYNLQENDQNVVDFMNFYERNIHESMKNKLLFELKLKKRILKQSQIYEKVKEYNSILGKKNETVLKRKQEVLTLIELIKKDLKEITRLKKDTKIKSLNFNTFKNSLIIENNNYTKLVINPKMLKFKYQDLTSIFDANIGSAKNKINLSEFKNIDLDLFDKDSIKKIMEIFILKDYSYEIVLSMDYNLYLDIELQLKNSNGKYDNIETMSAGELGKTYISNMIDSEIQNEGANIIIMFDQPENNLEKKFILNELATKIDELRNHYQVFITTHEPLLVVNADSNNIIQAENKKSAISSKNKISYKKLSFIDNSKSRNEMVDKIAELVDGSHEAVKERDKIYGGMLNENRS